MSDEIQEHDKKFVAAVGQKLLQHFDTVQIFVTRHEPGGGTMACSMGCGNFYARLGQIDVWLQNARDMDPNQDYPDGNEA